MNPLAVKAYGFLLGAALAAAGLTVTPSSLVSRAVVSYGHQGAVRDMVTDTARGLLFSTGDDGTLRVWDVASQTLIRRLAITRQIVMSLAIDPASPLAAVLVSDGARAFWIDVWNWETRELLYRIPLKATPLFVRFSLSGSYLLCGVMTWDSLRVYRAPTGERVPAFVEGGMIGFAEVSRSDATLMTYRLSGRITYEGLATGAIRQDVPAAADLVDIRASADRRYLVGHTGTDIVCVDAVTGETRFSLPAVGIVSLDVSAPADRIAWVTADGRLHGWNAPATAASSGAISSLPGVSGLGWAARVVRFDSEDLLIGGGAGQMVRLSPSGERTELARDLLARTSGVAVTDAALVVASGSAIRVFRTRPRLAEEFTLPSPFGGQPAGLLALDDGRVLAWKKGDEPGAIGVIDCASGSFTSVDIPFTSPLKAVAARGDRVFTLERGGRILGIDLATGRTVFQAMRPGAVCIAPLGDDAVVVGRAQTGPFRASLVRIDLHTGETVPLAGSETFTYALAPDPRNGILYSLAVDADGRTRLFQHEGPDLEKESIVDGGEEDLSASLALDPATGFLYSSLGRQRVTVWSGGSLRTIGAPSPGIASLRARDGLIVAAQRDSTVFLWDALNDRPVATLYPFSDGSWAAIFADGTVQGSGMAKVSFFAQGQLAGPADVPPKAGSAPAPSQETPVAP